VSSYLLDNNFQSTKKTYLKKPQPMLDSILEKISYLLSLSTSEEIEQLENMLAMLMLQSSFCF